MAGLDRIVEELSGAYDSTQPLQMVPATVIDLVANGAADGRMQIIVNYKGTHMRAPWLHSVAGEPQIGDTVVMLVQGQNRIIIGVARGVNFAPSPDAPSGYAPKRFKTFSYEGS